jgi:hypothetical protein
MNTGPTHDEIFASFKSLYLSVLFIVSKYTEYVIIPTKKNRNKKNAPFSKFVRVLEATIGGR